MKELDSKVNLWIRERLIPQLTENESNAKFTISRPTESFFLSDLFFVTVHTANSGNKSVAVKLPLTNVEDDVKIVNNYDNLFDNEILFYNQIARVHDEDYPKCYMAEKDSVFKRAIILEDVRQRGFTVSPKKVNVDLDYIMAGLKSIDNNPKNEELQKLMNNGVHRVSRAFRAKYPDSEFTAKISKVFEDAFTNVIMRYAEPVEPLATIVHGDCTINNILYRTRQDGKLESMLIDFGSVMYSSPVTDVAIFLHMTCKREDIRDRSEDLFTVYHDSLTECLKEHGISDTRKYPGQVFWQEYRKRAIYGYAGTSVFFRHIMTVYVRDNVIPEFSDSMAMIERYFKSNEGEGFLDLLVDMLEDLRVAGMLDHLIEK